MYMYNNDFTSPIAVLNQNQQGVNNPTIAPTAFEGTTPEL